MAARLLLASWETSALRLEQRCAAAGWRLVHLIADNEIYWEHAFGPGQRNFGDLEVPGTAEEGLRRWRTSRER